MAYPFDWDEDWIKDTLSRLSPQQPQEQDTAQTDPVTDATIRGLQKTGADIINPIARRDYAPKAIAAKELYDSADNAEVQSLLNLNADQIRQQASDSANMWRQKASENGFDLNGLLGSDVSLQDARNNLQTNDAKAIVDIFQGKYSKSADTFFESKYRDLMDNGMRPDKARRVAAGLAKQYQAERVSYLKGMYYGYGSDGRVRTPVGQEIVAQIALEEPQTASILLGDNPGQREAYAHDNELMLAALNNQGAMARLNKTLDNQLQSQILAGQISDSNAAKADWRDRESYSYKKNVDWADTLRRSELGQRLSQDEFDMKYNNLTKIANSLDIPEKERKRAVANAFGVKSNDFSKGTLEAAQKNLDSLIKQQENIQKILYPSNGLSTLTDEEKKYFVGELNSVTDQIKDMQDMFGTALGVTPDFSLPEKIAGDLGSGQLDIAVVNNIATHCDAKGMSEEQTAEIIYKFFREHGAGDDYAKKAVEYFASVKQSTGVKK